MNLESSGGSVGDIRHRRKSGTTARGAGNELLTRDPAAPTGSGDPAAADREGEVGLRICAPDWGPGTREAVPSSVPAVEHRVERAVSLRDPKLVATELPAEGSDSGEVGETCDGKVPVSGS
jgi:hypothetical protein